MNEAQLAFTSYASQKLEEQRSEIASLKQKVADLSAILHRAQNALGAAMGPDGSQDPMEALEAVEEILEGRDTRNAASTPTENSGK